MTLLTPVAEGPAVVVCSTCRHSARAAENGAGVRGGAALAAQLRRLRAAHPAYGEVQVQEMSCLFACRDFCAIHLRAPGKIGYVLGRFSASEEDARAILDYAAAYAASACGEVGFAQWPEGIKGHFITRTPPPGFVVG